MLSRIDNRGWLSHGASAIDCWQLDRNSLHDKEQPIWIFATIEVWSRV